jgi:hypothetical protein
MAKKNGGAIGGNDRSCNRRLGLATMETIEKTKLMYLTMVKGNVSGGKNYGSR